MPTHQLYADPTSAAPGRASARGGAGGLGEPPNYSDQLPRRSDDSSDAQFHDQTTLRFTIEAKLEFAARVVAVSSGIVDAVPDLGVDAMCAAVLLT